MSKLYTDLEMVNLCAVPSTTIVDGVKKINDWKLGCSTIILSMQSTKEVSHDEHCADILPRISAVNTGTRIENYVCNDFQEGKNTWRFTEYMKLVNDGWVLISSSLYLSLPPM